LVEQCHSFLGKICFINLNHRGITAGNMGLKGYGLNVMWAGKPSM
jgi:hypothetical protein